MKIYKNSISDKLLKECTEKIRAEITKPTWMTSTICWGAEIKKNITGSCMFCNVDQYLANKLTDELKEYFPEHDELIFQYYVWQHDAGISIHDDKGHKFGATLYLNPEWHVNWGGLFVWYDSFENYAEGKANCLIPKSKTLVLNDETQLHLVTPVSSTSPEIRVTIQIWGK
jgi:hypothetical protein